MEIPLVNALSRVTPTPVEEDRIQLPIVAVNLIMSNLPVSSTEIDLIHEETSKDPTLTLLKHHIHMGWPNECRILPCFRTIGKIYQWKMDWLQKGPDLSYLPHFRGR